MKEIELFINSNIDIDEVMLYVGPEYKFGRLKEFIDRTNVRKIVLTGDITDKQAEEIIEPIKEQASIGLQKIPEELVFVSYKDLFKNVKPIKAVVFECVQDVTRIYKLLEFKPKYLLGEMMEQSISSFALWERYRKISQHIMITTLRMGKSSQVLDWEKDSENNIEVSVIFPMYNVAKYLDQCIESVTAWKADYIEFLFINDGSPDNSREIVLEWAKKDSRIKLLDKPNGGCASARQWGLDRAKGKYIGFIDPDDFIDESMYRKLFRNAMIGSYEVSYCGYKEYYENTKETRDAVDVLGWPYNFGVIDAAIIRELVAYSRIAIWRGIYKRELIERAGIHFYTDLRRFDDLPFAIEIYSNAKSVISLEEYLYYYRLARPGQDVSADDDRLYVHFTIFNYLNDSVASMKNSKLTDNLQIRKIATHRYALTKIRDEFKKEYLAQAKKDLNTTGNFWRTFFMTKEKLGKKARLFYVAIMMKSKFMINILEKL